ncbi:MAG: FAD-binding protein [Acidobacteria bacterium]|nr:FAD-binding protein [Acidobacteriota bacterium]
MQTIRPGSLPDLASVLRDAASSKKSIVLGGASTKDAMAGPVAPADVTISTSSLNHVLEYDPRDLTISVEAGMPYSELTGLLAGNRQMIPLDPPFAAGATVGGVIATNGSGPRRRLYGTARDSIIGMKFITLDGDTVGSGGMVVKNVAGLDMAKMMIGSFGTLAAIAVVNFKVHSMPAATATFLQQADSAEAIFARRDALLRSVLQPSAVDVLNPAAARRVGRDGWMLAVEAGGNPETVARYARELDGFEQIAGAGEAAWWDAIREFTPNFLAGFPGGAVVRVSTTLQGAREVVKDLTVPAVVRAGNGVCYLYAGSMEEASNLLAGPGRRVIEFSPPEGKEGCQLWPSPGSDFAMMEKVKAMFDPARLLNRGKLYGRI